MAHSCRWRFPARPGGSSNSGTGRRGAAGRVRVTASLRGSPETRQPAGLGLGPGFDAALQVSAAIGSNLRKFRDVLGESSDTVSSGEVSTRGPGPGPGPGPPLGPAHTHTHTHTLCKALWVSWKALHSYYYGSLVLMLLEESSGAASDDLRLHRLHPPEPAAPALPPALRHLHRPHGHGAPAPSFHHCRHHHHHHQNPRRHPDPDATQQAGPGKSPFSHKTRVRDSLKYRWKHYLNNMFIVFTFNCTQEVHYIHSSMKPSLKPSQYNNDAAEIKFRKMWCWNMIYSL